MSDKGRLIMAFNPLSVYTAATDAVEPTNLEGTVDDSTGDLIIFKVGSDGTTKQLNPVGDLRTYINNLKNSGVFDNAEAFIQNRKIYRFYFDSTRMTARLDPELRFTTLYRYYKIRNTETTDSGGYTYLTGVFETGSDGKKTVTTNLVDLNKELSSSGDGTYVASPQVGGLISLPKDGVNYMVEFYDSNLVLVNQIVFQAIAVRVSNLDLSTDVAITDLYITTNRAVSGEDNACFLYRGENPSALEVRAYLKYSDGRERDVTAEQITGGRLTISGLSSISTDSVDATDSNTIQTFNITYQMIKTNATSSSDATTTTTGSILDPSTLTITKTIKCYIKEDMYDAIDDLIVAAHVDETAAGVKSINIVYFAHYASGAIHDVSSIVKYVSNAPVCSESGIGVTQSIIVKIPYGHAGEYKTFSYTLLATTSDKYAIINSKPVRLITADSSSNNTATGHSGKFTHFFGYDDSADATVEISFATLLSSMTYTSGGVTITPNAVRIRDVHNTTYLYTGYITDANSLYYDITPGYEFYKDKPLVVEFIHLETDKNGVATSVFVTGALVHYVRLAS